MEFSKVTRGQMVGEFVGTFTLALAVLASVWGSVPLIPTPVVAGLVLGLFVISIGKVSGAHLNPAVTLGQLSLRLIEPAKAVAYLIAQLAGALVAMVVMNLFLEVDLLTRVSDVSDYRVFFAEFLGAAIFTFGIASAVNQKLEGVNAALLVGGSLTVGILLATLGSNGILNPAVASALGVFNWANAFGPILGAVIGFNAYALAFGKRGKI